MGHRQIDHTADLALELWAANEVDLLEEGARAVIEILTEGERIERKAERRIEIAAIDAEDRLVQWLNEVLVLAIMEGFLLASAEIDLEGDTRLSARVHGEEDAGAKVKTELKSVTYHALELERSEREVRATIVIDV